MTVAKTKFQYYQWSTESRNIRPKQNIFTIRLSVSAAEILFEIFGLRFCLKNVLVYLSIFDKSM